MLVKFSFFILAIVLFSGQAMAVGRDSLNKEFESRRPQAISALGEVRKTLALWNVRYPGIELATEQMINLIERTIALKVVERPSLVGHFGPNSAGCEFGSTSSQDSGGMRFTGDPRLSGTEPYYVPATQVALSANIHKAENGNSFVMLDVRLPEAVEAFGFTSAQIHASLTIFPKDNKARLSARPVDGKDFELKETSGKYIEKHLLEREYTFALDDRKPKSWNALTFEKKPNGCIILLDPNVN